MGALDSILIPSLRLEEILSDGSTLTNPAADSRRLFLGEDGYLHLRDSAGAITDPMAGSSGAVATDAIWDAAGDLAIGTGANTAAKLTKGAAGTALIAGATTASWVDVLPWHIYIPCTASTPDATTGTWTSTTSSAQFTFPFYAPGSTANSGAAVVFQNNTGTAQNDAAAWDVVLAAGTWDAHFWVRRHSAAGIITLNQDGASQGTVDTYHATGDAAKVSITGWTVSTTGKKRMQLIAATKNASSSNYFMSLFAIEFRRTA